MKKNDVIKILSRLFVIIIMTFAFTACSDDDDDDDAGSGSLYGHWANFDEDIYIELDKDFSFWMEEDDNDCYGKYSVKGNTITITYVEYDEGIGVEPGDKIKFSVSGNTLVLTVNGNKTTFHRFNEGDFDDYYDDWL